ncbi:hypothetical protein BC827DRAFT_1269530 [Russula dissimulans]|nr:hypothetical protein BC827DRAFT_1269530 [Russula dissimulans]
MALGARVLHDALFRALTARGAGARSGCKSRVTVWQLSVLVSRVELLDVEANRVPSDSWDEAITPQWLKLSGLFENLTSVNLGFVPQSDLDELLPPSVSPLPAQTMRSRSSWLNITLKLPTETQEPSRAPRTIHKDKGLDSDIESEDEDEDDQPHGGDGKRPLTTRDVKR